MVFKLINKMTRISFKLFFLEPLKHSAYSSVQVQNEKERKMFCSSDSELYYDNPLSHLPLVTFFIFDKICVLFFQFL